jgi:hypothetical protein
MSYFQARRIQSRGGSGLEARAQAAPGKQTLTEAIQYKAASLPAAGAPAAEARAAEAPAAEAPAAAPSGGGAPLPADVRLKMERALGADFSAVRVHEGAEAASVGALAFTRGTDIFFQPGQYDPHSEAGQELLGHELTHVVQQAQGRVAVTTQAKGQGVNDDPALEREADERGARAARGEAAGHAGATAAAPGAVIQGKNLRQAGLASDVEDAAPRALVGTPHTVNTYSVAVQQRYEGKGDALQVAAMYNAEVGRRVDERWGTHNNRWTDPDKQTYPRERFNDQSLDKIDPFFFNVLVPYDSGHKVDWFDVVYQHAKNWSGYAVDFYDTGNQGTLKPSGGNQNTSTPSTMITTGHPGELEYTNVHDTRDGGNLMELTEGGEEKNLDAYTKLSGEGARWRCVRRHMPNLHNESYFFTEHPDQRGRVQAVTFKTLWLSWKDVFAKRYDIEDDEVRWAIRDRRFQNIVTKDRRDMDRRDYDLDTRW